MVKKTVYKHIGYYNANEDIKALYGKSAEEIVGYYCKGYGAFHSDKFDEVTLVLEEEEKTPCLKVWGDFVVTDETADLSEETLNQILSETEDCCYIDIWKYAYTEEIEDEKIYILIINEDRDIKVKPFKYKADAELAKSKLPMGTSAWIVEEMVE